MKAVFIDEQWFDESNPEEYPDYEGISWLTVYEVGYVYEEDMDEIEELSNNRDDLEVVGEALVGFSEEWCEVVEVTEGDFDKDDVTTLYPPL